MPRARASCSPSSTAPAATGCSTSTVRRRRGVRQRAHTSLGNAVHNALRDWWDLPVRTPHAGAALVDRAWIDVGFRDGEQSRAWRERMRAAVTTYLESSTRTVADGDRAHRVVRQWRPPASAGGSTGSTSATASSSSSTTRPPACRRPTTTPAPPLPLGLYAAAVWKMFRRRTPARRAAPRAERHGGGPRAHAGVADPQGGAGPVDRPRCPPRRPRLRRAGSSPAARSRRGPARCAVGATCGLTAPRARLPARRSAAGRPSRSRPPSVGGSRAMSRDRHPAPPPVWHARGYGADDSRS